MTNLVAIVTFYCHCGLCTPQPKQATASGKWPHAERTIAAPRWVPFGTQVIVEGKKYIVEDRMSGQHPDGWDIFVPTHKAALRGGKTMKTINFPTQSLVSETGRRCRPEWPQETPQ